MSESTHGVQQLAATRLGLLRKWFRSSRRQRRLGVSGNTKSHSVCLWRVFGYATWVRYSTRASVFHLGRSVRSCRQTAYSWTSCCLCRWRSCLERSSCRRHFSTFSVHFPKTFKTASFFTLLFWPCPLSHFFSLRGPCGSCLLLRSPKNLWIDWFWHKFHNSAILLSRLSPLLSPPPLSLSHLSHLS